MRARRVLAVLALAGSVIATGVPGAPAARAPLVPAPAYYRPVVVDGFAFPVARASWLSVIELAEDWHDPRFRLVDGDWELIGIHEGNDVTAEEGTPVVSMSAGRVEAVGWTFYSGTRVGIRGEDGKYYFYAHLSEVAPAVRVGAPVRAGDVIGAVGNTGYGPQGREDEFPPHLHVGIEGDDGWENPYPLIRRLYRASVAETTRQEEALAAASWTGDREAFDRISSTLYLPPEMGME